MNTYEYVKELKSVGVPEEQAEIHAKALVKSVMDNVASKGDIAELDKKIAVLETKLTMLQWAMGMIFGMNVTILIKLFWPH